MKKMNNIFNSVVAVIATFFTYLFGGWDAAIGILIILMVLDYITGVVYAYVNKNINLIIEDNDTFYITEIYILKMNDKYKF